MGLKKKCKCDPGAPAWMVSWSDMTTLLLTFFILMMSFAEIDGKDFYLVLSSFRGSLGMFDGGYSLSKGRLEEMGQNMLNLPSAQKGKAMAKSLKRAISVFKPEIRTKKVRVSEDERGIVVTLSGDSYFDPGSARLRGDIRPVLKKLSVVIKEFKNFVRIEGHTDNSPVSKKRTDKSFRSNWELSSARAINILRHLSEEAGVNAKQLSAVAFGEQRPLDDNSTPEGRAYNRRVDVIIVRDKLLHVRKHKKIGIPLPDEEWR